MRFSRERGILSVCAACGHEILDFQEAAARETIRELDAIEAAKPRGRPVKESKYA